MRVIDVETPHGLARAHLREVDSPRALLAVMHGAGVGVDSPDIVRASEVANEEGVAVCLVEQPYRVAGRRAPAPARQLDAAYAAVVDRALTEVPAGLPLLAGGRSLGARVACRVAGELGAIGVLCLAFPFRPPGRAGKAPKADRSEDLDAVSVPTLIVQGERDQFGMPPEGPNRRIAVVPGDHGLKADLDAVGEAVRGWIREMLAATQP